MSIKPSPRFSLVYAYPMRLAQGQTYHLSILQQVNALAASHPITLLSDDRREDLQKLFQDNFSKDLSDQLTVVKTSNRFCEIFKSNWIFLVRVLLVAKKSKSTCVWLYSRDLKLLVRLLRLRRLGFLSKSTRLAYECHQLLSLNLLAEGDVKGSSRWEKLQAATIPSVEKVFSINRLLVETILKKYSVDSTYLPLASSVENVAVASTAQTRVHDFIYAGNLSRWKGVEILIRALRHLKNKFGWSGTALVIGGSSDQVHVLRVLATSLGLEDHVTFLGRVPILEVKKHLYAAKIGVLPNVMEGDSLLSTSPMKLYDYANAGLAIIASEVPALVSECPREAAIFFKPGDEIDLARAADETLKNLKTMAEKSRLWGRGRTWNNRANTILEALQKCD